MPLLRSSSQPQLRREHRVLVNSILGDVLTPSLSSRSPRSKNSRAVALGRAVEERAEIGAEPWALEAVFDRVVRALALCNAPEAASAALQLGSSCRTQSTQSARAPLATARELAFLLATGQSNATLFSLLDQLGRHAGFEEVFSCWIQEVVVRGTDFSRDPSVRRFWGRLLESHHPLAVLPLSTERVEVELKDWLPQERIGGSSGGMPRGPSPCVDNEPRSFQPVEVTEVATTAGIASVVVNWQDESNGRAEARRFRFDRPTKPSAVSAGFMKALPLLCLEGAAVEQVVVRRVSIERALSILFAASANGGAYNRGRRAAYGRLELWQSVASLIGHQGLELQGLADTAADWDWYSFDAASPWFEQVAWDLGVAALSPDATTMSILAATDTD
ncbi:MAG TPA: DUF6183 family protein [Polyangiaceae bacterium]|nr:DUF6183 family protein [Polyangiaceae bacterium]